MTAAVESYADFFREAATVESQRGVRARSLGAKQMALAVAAVLSAAADAKPFLDGTWRVEVPVNLSVVLGLAESVLGREAPSVEKTKKSA